MTFKVIAFSSLALASEITGNGVAAYFFSSVTDAAEAVEAVEDLLEVARTVDFRLATFATSSYMTVTLNSTKAPGNYSALPFRTDPVFVEFSGTIMAFSATGVFPI